MTDDPYTAQHVREALATGPTAELAIDVTETAGGIFLSGIVASAEHRAELVARAREAAPTLAVHDDITVVHGEPDAEIEVIG